MRAQQIHLQHVKKKDKMLRHCSNLFSGPDDLCVVD